MKSIAIIPDGNRRYAEKHALPLDVAYQKGFEKVGSVVEWGIEQKLEWLGFWALSLENLTRRSSLELRTLFKLMHKHMLKAMGEREKLHEQGVSVKFFGRMELLPAELRESMRGLEEKTESNKRMRLNVGVAYSGQDELLRASTLLAKDLKAGKVDERALTAQGNAAFSKYLYFADSPDLIIRTGNVQRLSGFLPFQSAYSEYYFSPKLWPEFTKADFQKAVDYYGDAERRFGR